MSGWNHITDVRGFLSKKGQARTGTHNFSKKTLHWPYCVNCGLVWLKNETTRKAVKAACVWEED